MRSFIDHFVNILSILLDSAAAWFFCCVIAVFILPLILDRIFFYIPRLIRLSRNNEVYYRSIFLTTLEALLWTVIIICIYVYLYFFQNNLFLLATVKTPALIAWLITIMYIFRRLLRFDRTIKRNFYYEIYMRYIKPEALSDYLNFIEHLDTLELEDIKKLTNEPLRYMHKQAALRKLKEATMLLKDSNNEKIQNH